MSSALDLDSGSGERIIMLEIRGLKGYRFVKMIISDQIEKVRDLVVQLKVKIPAMRDAKDIRIFQGKYLLLPDEDLKIIDLKEEVIVMVAMKISDNYNHYNNYMVSSVIRRSTDEAGIDREAIFSCVKKGMSRTEMDNALDFLIRDGHIYYTIDNDHFKITNGD